VAVPQLVEHLFRRQAGQLVALLTRSFGAQHLELAEEVVQDALIKALQLWPHAGVPENPAGWLLQVARRQALDVVRRQGWFADREAAIAAEIERALPASPVDATSRFEVEDDELRMIVLCCDPSLTRDASVALALKTVGGFCVAEIARAFFVDAPTIAQRLVRAKRTLRDRDVRFEWPAPGELRARVDSVLEVIYLMFTQGYATGDGDALVREDVCHEALRLGELVAGHAVTTSPRAHALVALMAFQAARMPARTDGAGDLVLLDDQDPAAWDRALLARGFAALGRASIGDDYSSYHAQAAIAAQHAQPAFGLPTDWDAILREYDHLLATAPSPIVILNRAVAVGKLEGPAAALASLRALDRDPTLSRYALLPAVQGHFWRQLGDRERAAAHFREALTRPCSAPERRFLARRLAEAAGTS
jgi:RNA polymerase sigma-70 factor (ECF subfamily)